MKRFLVVEDDADVRALLAEVLAGEGFAVRAAADGLAALEAAAAEPPDLVVTDLYMPRLDGLAMIDRLWTGRPGLPVLVVSAGLRVRPPAGVPFLAKPFDVDRLLTTVGDLLAG